MHFPEFAAVNKFEVEGVVDKVGGCAGYASGNNGAVGSTENYVERLAGDLFIRWINKVP